MLNLIETKIPDMPTIEAIIGERKIFLYSKYDPRKDSMAFAESVFSEGSKNYFIYGLGLGYHIQELINLIDMEDYHIYIAECNKVILSKYNDLIKNPNVTIIPINNIKEDYNILVRLLAIEGIRVGIHKPSLSIMSDEFKELRYLLEEFTMVKETMERNLNVLDENFNENIKNYDYNVDMLFDRYIGKPIYIVSAGPSLDKNIGELARVGDDGIILCVGRAVRTLLNACIIPDYIIITDPNKGLYNWQLKDLDLSVPIIVLSTCDKGLMMEYAGDKYIALQEGYLPAESYARENNHKMVRTGGSVATTALDVAIRMGGNPIIFVGQDLGFTGNKSHSKDTFSRDISNNHGLRDVEDVNGDIIQTSKNLYIYLRWIQNRIREEKSIDFIDATEGGARIDGTRVLKLKDVMNGHF